MFRVVSDQLKLRGGLVRCGNCRHVFDAIGSLSYIEESALASAPAPTAAAAAPVPAATPAAATPPAIAQTHRSEPPHGEAPAPALPPKSDDARPASPDRADRPRLPEAVAGRTPPPAQRDEPPARAADPLAVPTLLAPNVGEDVDSPDTGSTASTEEVREAEVPATSTGAQPAETPRGTRRPQRTPAPAETRDTDSRQEEDEDEPSEAAEVSFLQERRPSRGFSIIYGGGSLLLALLLGLQAAVLFRTELLTRWPELRPRLVDICDLYGCSVGWPTRAEMLAVIGTELQAVPGTDILELTAVVRNRAPYRVALPAVEVTLTDTNNRTLARKVFAPVDYLASSGEPSSRINEGLGPGSDYVVRITFEARGLNAAGFVVYPFYL